MWKATGTALIGAATLAISATPALGATSGQISVNGSGEASVPAGATYTQQQAAYDAALTAASTDASSKAQLVAQQLSLTLGPVVSFTEESYDYLGYCGVAFAPGVAAPTASGVSSTPSTPTTAGSTTSGSSAGTQLTPIPKKSTKHKAKKHAQRTRQRAHHANAQAHAAQASDQTCELEADVTIVYTAS